MLRTRSLAAAIGPVLLLFVSVFVAPPAGAGGSAFTAEVLDFQDLGNDEYRLVLRQLTSLYVSDSVPAKPITIRLRHDETAMRDSVSKEEYVAAIALLRQQIAQSATIQFGVMGGSGLAPIDGRPGELQSNGLTIEDGIVYAWNGATQGR